ncbi:Cationic amino acid transporter 4, vacuolar [Linum grandiflorum]
MVAAAKCVTSSGFGSLIRRKQVDSVLVKRSEDDGPQLAQRLSVIDVIAIGVGATIGAGVYVLVGTVAREQAGPALTLSFLIAGIAAALSAFCYAELASRCPSAGSAYHYAYICIGEGAAWLIGWALILEYTLGGSAIARGLTPNLALFFGGQENLPSLLARHSIPALGIVVDPCAAILVLIVTVLLCMGIKESSLAQTVVTTINIFGMIFIIIAGGYIAFKNGWPGYELDSGYLPFGLNGMLAGSGIVFFSFIGFDVVASTAEEVKNPKRDLPIGMGIALAICCVLYMLVSVVVVGLVPYYALDPDTPISSAFASYGMQWAVYIITAGAVTALCASLMGSLLPQPRMFMAMARDGLLPSFFSDIDKHTQVPVKSTIVIGILAAALAFFMDVSQLAGMVSVGTLLAFTAVAVSVLILRYVPPDVVPVPSSLHGSIDVSPLLLSDDGKDPVKFFDHGKALHQIEGTSAQGTAAMYILTLDDVNHEKRRMIAAWSITVVCIGVLILTCSASSEYLPRFLRFTSGTVGGGLLLCGLVILACIAQDNGRHSFGHTGGFTCPLVPYLPVACILVNTYLLVNLGGETWLRVSLWLLIGALIYVFYGRSHSSLMDVVYVPTSHANKAYHASSSSSQD